MSKWSIHKTLDFCYGHRVFTQKLNGEFSADLKTACRHIHGHEGSVVIYLEGDTLDDTGMVTDFRHLEWAKKFINEHIDHQFIICIDDPMFDNIVLEPFKKLTDKTFTDKFEFYENDTVALMVPNTGYVAGYKPFTGAALVPAERRDWPEFEIIEGITIVDFVPTSENLSKWLADLVQAKMERIGVTVSRVDWYETPRSCSTYMR